MLAVTERRLLWLLDDAPVGRVRSLAFRDVDERVAADQAARRHAQPADDQRPDGSAFADLRPPTAAAIERHVRERCSHAS